MPHSFLVKKKDFKKALAVQFADRGMKTTPYHSSHVVFLLTYARRFMDNKLPVLSTTNIFPA